jgi:hypothetical protein
MDAQKPAGKMYKKYVKICGATPFPQELHVSMDTQKSPMSTVQAPLESPFIVNNVTGGKPKMARNIFDANNTVRGRKFIPSRAFTGRENRHIGITIREPS